MLMFVTEKKYLMNLLKKKATRIVAVLILIASVTSGNGQEVCYNPNLVKDTTKKSIKSMAVGLIGSDTVLKIIYHSPGVRNRVIWGGLVPYGEVWVTGAHNATSFEFSRAVTIGGKQLPAGKYAFFTIPGKKEWTLIINRHWDQHLASEYDEKDDVVRITIKPKKNRHTERLQYFAEDLAGKNAGIAMAWEKIRIWLPVTFN